ncbi:hypothetical protein Tco_0281354 [Tanacetum coccineum]
MDTAYLGFLKVWTTFDIFQNILLEYGPRLNEKLISLNRFLSKSTEKSLPFFKTLKGCLDKTDFTWTKEADKYFEEMKRYIEKLPTLVAPKAGENLIVYLAASKEKKVDQNDEFSEAGDKLKGSANGSISAGHFKVSEIPRTGGSMVGLLEDVIKVGQVMGFKMEGVIANLEELIGTQGGKEGYR